MDNNNNKHQGIALTVALIAAASLLSLGAVAATTITPAYAGGDDDGVKQKAESEADYDQKNKVEDGEFNEQFNEYGLCWGISANVNDLTIAAPNIGVIDGKLVQYEWDRMQTRIGYQAYRFSKNEEVIITNYENEVLPFLSL